MPLQNKKKTLSRLKTAKRIRKVIEQFNCLNNKSKEEQQKILDEYNNKW